MLRSHKVVLAALAALVVSITLQGCGGGSTPTPAPTVTKTTTTKTTDDPTTTTHTTSTLVPPPAPPAPSPAPLLPLRGVVYTAAPTKEQSPVQLPPDDMMQDGYKMQWGPEGRDDLGQIKRLGATAVRASHGMGLEYMTDHKGFLDRAHDLGLNVIVGVHSTNLCPDFNCYQTWRDSIKNSSKVGFVQDKKWHPAIAMFVIFNSKDVVTLWESQGVAVNCTVGEEAKCRVRAELSAMHGFLQAEKDLGITSSVNLTIVQTFEPKDSIDGKVSNAEYFGLQDIVAGIADPKLADYKCDSDCADMLTDAFDKRWIHSFGPVAATWSYTNEKINDHYKPYEPKPWFIAEYAGTDSIEADLPAMESAVQTSSFQGVMVADYQKDYVAQTPTGIFALGETSLGKEKPCQEDVFTKEKLCYTQDVWCLDAAGPDNGRAESVAKAWKGTSQGHGQCRKKTSATEEEIVF